MVLLGATVAAACTDPTAAGGSGDPSATQAPSELPLALNGAVLHEGNYCHFDQVITPGNNSLPVEHGCLFNLTKAADVFATDGNDYSVSEVVGDARLGVRGPADARVLIACRLSPRAEFWFWVSSDGHWNISEAVDIHHPQDLVGKQDEESMRQYVNVGGVLNDVEFKCAGGQASPSVTLAVNMNGHQFTALTVQVSASGMQLDRPQNPWFVDVGARLVSPGTLEGTVGAVILYQSE